MPIQQVNIAALEVAGGKISVGHRPKLKLLKDFKQSGVSHIWTLLSEHEGAAEINKAARKNGLQWVWLPLENGKPPEHSRIADITDCFARCKTLLTEGAHLYLHCSAGIHRTGMIGYAFFRYLGLSRTEALHLLENLRSVTSNGVGESRLAWGDDYFAKKL
ncbi:hypothetical protein [Arsukibacterium sp.]|uniref:protein-tyrosine phosphatase family protein n=1 Tax=Arsukibacterium sp. TaxID=1977258 RepID=UPI003563160F